MNQHILIPSAAEYPHQESGIPAFDPTNLDTTRPDEHWVALSPRNRVMARCSIWWRATPAVPGERVGIIGHFAAADASGCSLLDNAVRRLAGENCTLAAGPMDGNTWRRYRFITERGAAPPFFLEPDHPDEWVRQWTVCGFRPWAAYFSAVNQDLAHEDPQVARAAKRLKASGIELRSLDPGQYERELRVLYSLSIRCFTGNFLYTPIAEAEFLAEYEGLRSRIRPEMILIAEHQREPVGFVFALPDWIEAMRGQPIQTAVLKTVAVLAERRCAGLGAWLVAEAQSVARRLGHTRVIHALMHESNSSLNLSARYAQPFRKYALFSKPL